MFRTHPVNFSSRHRPYNSARFYTLAFILFFSTVTLTLAGIFATTLNAPPLTKTTLSSNLTNPSNTSDTTTNTTLSPRLAGPLPGYVVPIGRGSLPLSSNATNGTSDGALFFYTGTFPSLSIIHAIVELFTEILAAPHPSTPAAHPASLLASSVLALAWIANNGLWTYCDVAPWSRSQQSKGACPAPLDTKSAITHRELAVAKNVFAWFVLAAYAVHVAVTLVQLVRKRREGGGLAEMGAVEKEVDDGMSVNTVTGRED